MPMHQSIRTIDGPEFINLKPLEISPLMSACEIKVLYIGQNRNRSFISKEVATEMAKTLRGAPIVGYYREDKEDFEEHSSRVIIDNDGIKFECLTKPYGFVAPDAQVWFQNFDEQDDFGNPVTRTYMMTTGYLWSGQFPECKCAVDDGRPQSMELDEATLEGHWANDTKSNLEFFIINDAIFSKLCILGEDVEPCFEGSSIKTPEISKDFSLSIDDQFRNTLNTMMQQLTFALQGGNRMENTQVQAAPEAPVTETPASDFTAQDNSVASTSDKTDMTIDTSTSFKKSDDEEEKKDAPKDGEDSSENKDDKKEEDDKKKKPTENKCDDDKDDKKKYAESEQDKKDKEDKYSLLESQYNDLKAKFSALEADYKSLYDFKCAVDREKKQTLIAEFAMLTDEDKKDVIANIDKYSYDEIEAKLAVIGRRKCVNFGAQETKPEPSPATTFSLGDTDVNGYPAWVREVMKNQ